MKRPLIFAVGVIMEIIGFFLMALGELGETKAWAIFLMLIGGLFLAGGIGDGI